jgi:CRISPR-associated protein Cas2
MLILVVYDIPDDKRRLKLSNFLEGQGRRVQKSLEKLEKLHQQVKKRVKPEEDNVRFYWIPADAVPRTLTIGSPPPEPPPEVYIL